MRIYYLSGYSDWWGRYPPDVLDRDRGRTVGGGEAGMLETAFGLAKRGHDVVVWSCAEPGHYRGVEFRDERRWYRDMATFGMPDAAVAWTVPDPLNSEFFDGVPRLLVQQLNDLAYWPGWEGCVDVLVSPADHHSEFMKALGWRGAVASVHNGCHPHLWALARPWAERPLQVGYWSSPDRGLHHLLRVWPRVRAAEPRARLVIGYEIQKVLDIAKSFSHGDHHMSRIDALRVAVAAARLDPTIQWLGAVSRPRLREVQMNTRVFCYPSDGIGYTEGFGIAVLEACAAGAFPVVRPVDALPSIYGDAVRWLPDNTGSPEFDDAIVESVLYGLREWNGKGPPSLDDLRRKAEEFTWDRATSEMEEAIRLARAAGGENVVRSSAS